MILSDNETKVDLLNNRAIAKTVTELIQECGDNPISIGIHGDWGAGKSSVLMMIEEEFKDNTVGVECIRFNGWKHQGFEDAKIALMSAIVSELSEKKKLTEIAKDTLKKIWKSINWIDMAKTAGSLVLTATTGIPPITILNNVFEGLRGTLSDRDKVSSGIEKIGTYLNNARVFEDTSLAKEFTEFQTSFDELLQKSNIKKLVILVDDLDRCLPKVTIETLEAMRLFMFSKSTAFVIAADESMIEYAVHNHFPNIEDNDGKKSDYGYSRRYLEKLIQVPFRIPVLGEIESGIYITLLLIGSALKEYADEFNSLREDALKLMKKPWENFGFSVEQLQKSLGTEYKNVGNEINVSNQIASILAKNTQGNPRQIKRFINMILLRKRVAKTRGFGDDINISVLSKLMLAEYFFGDEYKKIASTTDNTGKCLLLDRFENILLKANESDKSKDDEAGEEKIKAKKKSPSGSKATEFTQDIPESWDKNNDFKNWALSEPNLGKIDLRPYFFASKVKEDFFFDPLKSDHLQQLVTKLMSGTMVIANATDEIKDISETDAKKIFDILAIKIQKSIDISTAPKGIDGIKALVTQHRELDMLLANFIDTFDCSKVGPWICVGWNDVIKSKEAISRLVAYFNRLKDNGTPLVKTALQNTFPGVQ